MQFQLLQRWQQQHGNASVLPAQLKNIMQGGSSVPLGLASGSLTIQVKLRFVWSELPFLTLALCRPPPSLPRPSCFSSQVFP
jgi:hypothetical protein